MSGFLLDTHTSYGGGRTLGACGVNIDSAFVGWKRGRNACLSLPYRSGSWLACSNEEPLTSDSSVDVWLDQVERDPHIEIVPLSARIAAESVMLGEAFHKDPADRSHCALYGFQGPD